MAPGRPSTGKTFRCGRERVQEEPHRLHSRLAIRASTHLMYIMQPAGQDQRAVQVRTICTTYHATGYHKPDGKVLCMWDTWQTLSNPARAHVAGGLLSLDSGAGAEGSDQPPCWLHAGASPLRKLSPESLSYQQPSTSLYGFCG